MYMAGLNSIGHYRALEKLVTEQCDAKTAELILAEVRMLMARMLTDAERAPTGTIVSILLRVPPDLLVPAPISDALHSLDEVKTNVSAEQRTILKEDPEVPLSRDVLFAMGASGQST